jgi:hypothetical protein
MADIFTSVGEQFLCDFLAGVVATDADWVGWGTGAGTAAKGSTTLNTEASETRIQGTMSVVGTGASAVYQVVATLTADAGKTITNAGLFTAVTSGTLVIHGDFTGVVLALGDKIEFTFTLAPA